MEAWDQRLARLAVKPLKNSFLHPNHLTTLGLLLGIAAAFLFASGVPALARVGAVCFVLTAWMDHVDGEHARATGKTSRFGHYYDHFAVFTAYVALFVGIGFGQRAGGLGDWAVPMGVVAGLAIAITFSIRLVVEIRQGHEMVAQENFLGFEMEDALYVVAPVTWLGGLQYLLIAAATVAPIFMAFTIWQTWRGRNVTAGWR